MALEDRMYRRPLSSRRPAPTSHIPGSTPTKRQLPPLMKDGSSLETARRRSREFPQHARQEGKQKQVPNDKDTLECHLDRHVASIDGAATRFHEDEGPMDIDPEFIDDSSVTKDTNMLEPHEQHSTSPISPISPNFLIGPIAFSRSEESAYHEQWFTSTSRPNLAEDDTSVDPLAARGLQDRATDGQNSTDEHSLLDGRHRHDSLFNEDSHTVGDVGSAIRSFQLLGIEDTDHDPRRQLELKRLEVAMFKDRVCLTTAQFQVKKLEYELGDSRTGAVKHLNSWVHEDFLLRSGGLGSK
ncbi:unnamed protein product [Zymoseptoria tritici ST99CH_1A5]|uniref:Uncharacterized protein n=2 Tax=Zymoseptoria tritici TaxID=1047171 RepID=A0A2H1G5I8_ZYMTR|nr:unnamed protein product [Zymoseptoria tritici ST99CH_1E4]SMY22706.1 unnamed protein product [Zymoseptoria tritici ST99CH_1A5]